MTRLSNGLILFFLVGLTGCSSPGRHPASAPDTAIRLTAALISPVDIKLEWHDPVPGAAGHSVEYTSDLKDGFVTLAFCPPNQTTYIHPRLIPETRFYYRVRPYYGAASRPVEVSLPLNLTDAAYVAAYALPEDYSWAAPATVPEKGSVAKYLLRNTATFAKSAPSDLKAELATNTVSGFKFTWTNHSIDDDGLFLERKLDGNADFSVCALLEPKINSFGWAFEPPTRKGTFRVRAFYFGKPSDVVMKITGKDPQFSE
jgi:hypothetical protein